MFTSSIRILLFLEWILSTSPLYLPLYARWSWQCFYGSWFIFRLENLESFYGRNNMWQEWRLTQSCLWMHFFTMELRHSFIVFEIEVLKHLIIAPSQFHPTWWVYMNVYQYWCKHLNREPFVILFFHLFKFNSII